jgi:ComF family protein
VFSPARQSSPWGAREAVFSSSEDRTRAGKATVPEAGASIVLHKPRTWAGHAADSLFAVLFPSDCRICRVSLTNISRLPVCDKCLDAIHPLSGKACSICSERVFSPYLFYDAGGAFLCRLCYSVEPPFEKAVAYGRYEEGLRDLIHLLKYGGVRPAANVLGRMLAEAIVLLEPVLGKEPIAAIPVPLYTSKRRERGFNQAELIARAALKLKSAGGRLRLACDVLERRRETKSQIGMTPDQRRENMRGAFAVTRSPSVDGREVLLVDDVYTTGATVSECARVLLRAGASRVWVATVARTPKLASQFGQVEPPADQEISEAAEATSARAS